MVSVIKKAVVKAVKITVLDSMKDELLLHGFGLLYFPHGHEDP